MFSFHGKEASQTSIQPEPHRGHSYHRLLTVYILSSLRAAARKQQRLANKIRVAVSRSCRRSRRIKQEDNKRIRPPWWTSHHPTRSHASPPAVDTRQALPVHTVRNPSMRRSVLSAIPPTVACRHLLLGRARVRSDW